MQTFTTHKHHHRPSIKNFRKSHTLSWGVIGASMLLIICASLIVVIIPTQNQVIDGGGGGYSCPVPTSCLPTFYEALTVNDMIITGNLTIVNKTEAGLITSIDLVVPADIFQVTSPVFTAGPAVLSFETLPQQPNEFWGGPAAGPAVGSPAFRALEAADLPVVPVERGGTNSNVSLVGNRVMISDITTIHESDPMFDGFLVIGQTGGPPVSAALVPGAGMQITNGPGSISLAATGACTNGTKMSTSCIDISNMMCPNGALDANCIPGTLSFDTLYVNNLIAINSTQRTIISANASILQVEHLIADRFQLSGDFECIAGPGPSFGNIATNCYDISGKTCTYPVDNTCLPTRIGSINGVLPDSVTFDFGITSGGTGLGVTPTTNGIILSNTGVTSVALSVPSIFSVSGSPVTTTGTLTASLATQSANTLFAGPTTGAASAPTFRTQVLADLPHLTDGQLYVGSTGASVAAASITAGFGISVTPGAGSLTVAATSGTVTSVALSLPSLMTVSGSPVTTTGTLTGTLATQTANTVFSGPASGAAAAPTFRSLVIADISGALNSQYVSATSQISGFSSGSVTSIMGVTPAAGTYFVSFSASFGPTGSPCQAIFGICKSMVMEAAAQRYVADYTGIFAGDSQVVVTVDGTQAIDACWYRSSGSCTWTVYQRTLMALRIA